MVDSKNVFIFALGMSKRFLTYNDFTICVGESPRAEATCSYQYHQPTQSYKDATIQQNGSVLYFFYLLLINTFVTKKSNQREPLRARVVFKQHIVNIFLLVIKYVCIINEKPSLNVQLSHLGWIPRKITSKGDTGCL